MTDSSPGLPALALVLTHRRPRLAGDVVRQLIDVEGFAPADVVLVINGDGGLDDAELEASVDRLHLPANLGPAGGFRAGLEHARRRLGDARWVYLCEDDVGLFDIPGSRVSGLIDDVEAAERGSPPVGAVFAYARDLSRRTGITVPHVPSHERRFEPADVACWGATLLSRAVLDAGVLPDDEWFFGYEDFDYWLRVSESGFRLLVDSDAARAVAGTTRDQSFQDERPLDADEPWRAYYVARNFFALARRHGNVGWTAWHLAKSVRRLQRARSAAERRAIVRGVLDGVRRRSGVNRAYVRAVGEL